MGSLANESFNIELQQLDAANDTARKQRTQWLLTSPNPPSFCHELINTVKKTVLPHGKNIKQSRNGAFFSFFKGLFPILSWGRNYKGTKFKHDIMAGLTLASLCIPQESCFHCHILHWCISGSVWTIQGKRNKKMFWLPAIAPLISVVLSTLIVYLTKADQHGVKIVKHFKGGLNPSSLHQLQFNSPHIGELAKIGLICAIVALTEAIAVGRSFASIKGYRGICSFSRTAVNISAGCETVVSNIVMAITVLISLELLTKLLYYTPLAILASIIISALPGLIDISETCHIWKVDKTDFIICIAAFFGVLFGYVEIGLLIAVGISFGKIVLGAIRPSVELQGRLPGTDTFCDITQFPVATEPPGILIIRVNNASLCFANVNFIRGGVDTSGIVALEELHRELVSQGIHLAIANPRWKVINKLKAAKILDKLGKGWIFLTVGDAVDACLNTKMTDLSTINC
ncbi:hypothetical protein K7X08_002230 [Anisodus acutangulus]|uniref:STAS domain-containing protein n=1 Tax=Anisodus acutangulus TaxID=402998 RepID=A0A9Q1R3Z1_9SOLA|nr:hypothetical protein K7X08_002230 [Anisodus acutangulus]